MPLDTMLKEVHLRVAGLRAPTVARHFQNFAGPTKYVSVAKAGQLLLGMVIAQGFEVAPSPSLLHQEGRAPES